MLNLKTVLCAGVAASLLSSCAFLKQEPKSEPNATWKEGKNYYLDGDGEATAATVSYSQGNFKDAEEHLINALTANPKHPQALMVGALLYEQTGRLNRARQYYEDLILVGGEQTTVLGTEGGVPEKMSEVARKRLRLITMQQTKLVVEDKQGNKVFDISEETSQIKGRSAMEEALFRREQKLVAENRASSEADLKAVEVLFNEHESNMISRFLIMKELAEKDLITKNEFLKARQANIGALLPLTNQAPGYGVEKPVPSAELIIERINSLKEATEARAITPREFSAERSLIVEAILPPAPRTKLKNRAPARDILAAAKEMRKIEVIYDLNLITSKEKEKEQRAIEKSLGLNKTFAEEQPEEELLIKTTAPEVAAEPVEAPKAPEVAQTPITPGVSSPF